MLQACGGCGGETGQPRSVNDAKRREVLTLVTCKACGLVQQSPMPSEEALRIYYSHHYREDYKTTHRPKSRHVQRAAQAAAWRLEQMARAGITGPLRTLDVGAGGGEFVYMARKAGLDASGVEPHHGYSAHARDAYGVSVVTGQLHEIEPQAFEVITLFHVLEHLPQPASAMAWFAQLLQPGGRLVVEVPNLAQPDASPHNIYFKAHLYYFSRPSLLCTASRFFEPVLVEDTGNLLAVFQRRTVALDKPLWPSAEDLAWQARRLQEKGWMEYLWAGGGLRKAATRLPRMLSERTVKDLGAREILDRVAGSRGW